MKHASLIDFHGYEMPLWYEGIGSEHLAVRKSVGVFDVTHMGRGLVLGSEARDFLNHIFTYDVTKIALNQAWVTSMCDEKGIIIDDMMVYHLNEDKYLLVFNCLNRDRDVTWVQEHIKPFDATFISITDQTPHFAVQGPKAQQTMQKIINMDVGTLTWFEGAPAKVGGVDAYVSRTGYTGEDGFEVYLWDIPREHATKAVQVWNAILAAGQEFKIQPCGLGARDTARIEAGFWLEGNECNGLKVTPLELGFKWGISLEKSEFIGRDVLLQQVAEGVKRKRVNIRMLEGGIPRVGYDIYKAEERIGQVTSGTFSPILSCGIAMGYVPTEHTKIESVIEVKVREKLIKGTLVKVPFYDPEQYGRLRRRA